MTAPASTFESAFSPLAWDYLPRLLRSAWRDSLHHAQHRDNVGFRVARTLAP